MRRWFAGRNGTKTHLFCFVACEARLRCYVLAGLVLFLAGCACSMEQRAKEESAGTIEVIARAGVSGFVKYLHKVDNKITSIRHAKGKGKDEEDPVKKATDKWANSRCGGRGACQIFGPWDGKRPHGVGKAKFLMVCLCAASSLLPPASCLLPLVIPAVIAAFYSKVSRRVGHAAVCSRIWDTFPLSTRTPVTCTTNSCVTSTLVELAARYISSALTAVPRQPLPSPLYTRSLAHLPISSVLL